MECPNAPDCNIILPYKDWALHIKNCIYKKIKCLDKCGLELKSFNYYNVSPNIHDCTISLKY